MEPIVRAIDVGYGNIKYIAAVDGQAIRCAHFPSAAPYCTFRGDAVDSLGERRRTVRVAVGDLLCEVGPDVHLAADIYQTRQMHDGYCETPEYLALVRGALSYMRVDKVDLLVLGLPVSTFRTKREALERRMRGMHTIEPGKSVSVERVKVVAQPQGALMHYGALHKRLGQINNERNLVVDAGARTFDWLLADGLRVIDKRSDSANKGMFDVLHIVAEAISAAENTNFRDYERIDLAIRTGCKPKVFGKEHDIGRYVRTARRIADEAVGEMLRYVGNGSDINNIVLVGGAASFYKPALVEAFPKHKVHEIGDGLYANVKGFQFAGMQITKSQGAPSASHAVHVAGAEGAAS